MYIIFFGILSFLATFGLIEIIRFSYCEWQKHDAQHYIVVPVKNNQDEVEGIIRSTILKTGTSSIIAVDLGSADNTVDILLRLQSKYTDMRIYTLSQYMDFLSNHSMHSQNTLQ